MRSCLRAATVAFILVAACVTAACDITVNGLGSDRYVEREKKEFQVAGIPDVLLSTFDGSIEVRAWDRADVSVEIEKRGANKEATDQIQVTAEQSGNRVTVEVKDPKEGSGHFGLSSSRSARLIVSVPRQANVEARTGDGSVTVERVSGQLRVNTGDGSVKITDVAGGLKVHTGDGSVSLDHVDGMVDAETGDGSITMNGKVEGLRLRTGDGTVHVRAASGSRMADDWEVHTGDGSIGLELPEPFDANLDAHTGDGSVSVSNVPVKGEVGKQSVRGQLGNGGKTLKVTSGDGTILISRS